MEKEIIEGRTKGFSRIVYDIQGQLYEVEVENWQLDWEEYRCALLISRISDYKTGLKDYHQDA